MRFAAENAEAMFTAAPTKAILRETVSTIRSELELAGRDPYAAKIFNLTTIITGETDEEAHTKHAEYLSYGDPEGALVPVLTARGAYQSGYAPGTLRNKLLGRGDRLADEHRGAGYRVGGKDSTIIERPSTVPSSSVSTSAQPAPGR